MGRILLVLVFGLVGCQSRVPEAARPSTPEVVTSFRVPPDQEIPPDQVGASIRRGRALMTNTKDSLPTFVGNALRCTSCHLEHGTRPGAAPWVGVYSRFPQYRARNGKINVIQDRINDCFQRSLNGRPLPPGGRDMADIISYMAFLSRGVAPPGDVPGQGFAKIDPLPADPAKGRLVYAAQCARCHGGQGEGMRNPDSLGQPGYYPPVFGAGSYSIGAGMARLRTAASFIRDNMPFDKAGTLSDQEAFDVASYINTQGRPDFGPKANDWPNGDPPPDVAYRTKAAGPKPRP